MKKLAVALAATLAILSAKPTETKKHFEQYFQPTHGDTITIHKTDSMRVFLKNAGWDGTFESLMKTINDIRFPDGYDENDNNYDWLDAINYGGVCIHGSIFLYTALKTAGFSPVMGIIRGCFVELDKKGDVVRISAGLVPENESHMVCFVEKNGKVYAGSQGLEEVKGDTVDLGLTIWHFGSEYKNVMIYPLLTYWPKGAAFGDNVLPGYIDYLFKNGMFIKINTDGFSSSDWQNIWPDVVKYLKKGCMVVFTRGEPKW